MDSPAMMAQPCIECLKKASGRGPGESSRALSRASLRTGGEENAGAKRLGFEETVWCVAGLF